MYISQTLQWAFKHLRTSDSPNLDAEVLLSFVLNKPKEFLYAHPQQKITKKQDTRYKQLINRRAKGEPVAYLTGHKEFYGLDFAVNKNVLIPRPETELLVEETLKILNTKYQILNTILIDIGTGSGCIPISIAKTTLPNCHSERSEESLKIYATDLSPAVLKIARLNARRHGVAHRIKFLRGNLLCPLLVRGWSTIEQLNNSTIFILANLPYLTTKQWRQTPPDVRLFEPRQALDGGPDGLKYFRKLFQQIKKLNIQYPISNILLEIDSSQTKKMERLTKKYFPFASLQIKKDLAGRDRIVIIKS